MQQRYEESQKHAATIPFFHPLIHSYIFFNYLCVSFVFHSINYLSSQGIYHPTYLLP